LAVVGAVLRARIQTLAELPEKAAPFYQREVTLDPAAAQKLLKPEVAPVLRDLLDAFRGVPEWSLAAIERAFLDVVEAKHALKIGKAAQPLRVALTGGTASPGIYETVFLVGRQWTCERLEAAIRRAETPAQSA
ncbi:MAG: glutamate--tRNA ligase, partial [Deferrisomatales bacterium]